MTPQLSIVIATTLPWVEIQACLRSLAPQLVAAQAEVIVGDTHSGEIPDDILCEFPFVQWLRREGMSVFHLRNLGLLAAKAPVVAFTEDHCVVAPDWCERLLAAHRAQPAAAAVGGSVNNGSTDRAIDWANFLFVFAPFLPPVTTGPAEQISLQANISYKRDALPQAMNPNGLMEMALNRELVKAGRMLYADGGLCVRHIQSHGFRGSFAAHFHNGRSIATVRMEKLKGLGRALRLASCAILPAFLFVYVARHVASKPRFWGPYIWAAPFIAGLTVAQALGEFCGYAFGPGNSLESVR